MPKLKTNKAAKRRFKITGRGKVLKQRTGRRHLLTDKRSGKKRSLRRWERVDRTDEKRFRTLLPYA